MKGWNLPEKIYLQILGGAGGIVGSESALIPVGKLMLKVRAPPLEPSHDGGPESLISTCCGLALYTNQTKAEQRRWSVLEEEKRRGYDMVVIGKRGRVGKMLLITDTCLNLPTK
ncbi:hypothetical protein PoB_005823000 [Plakobranchus ocellatus]|uniref:Uncharacterized protein n=1 Tax=Plakobranchus ocellatus TaxID=259542 RepID=A0AAV4CJF9_9GAST|nr:hypothetical protein PoB_005823000 [Plakobranchus ocellatus]